LSDGSTELMRVTYSAEKPTLKTDDHKIVLKHAQTTAPDMLVRLTSVGVKANPVEDWAHLDQPVDDIGKWIDAIP
jgi:hypothetical protein